jgi:hypothetical protein
MGLLHADLLRFSHDTALAYMLILYIEEVNLMRLFSNQPLFCISNIISLSFGLIADMEGIKASIQILHLIIHIFEIFDKILVINSIVFNGVKDFFYVSVKCIKGTDGRVYINTILKLVDVLIKPYDIRHYQLFFRAFLM